MDQKEQQTMNIEELEEALIKAEDVTRIEDDASVGIDEMMFEAQSNPIPIFPQHTAPTAYSPYGPSIPREIRTPGAYLPIVPYTFQPPARSSTFSYREASAGVRQTGRTTRMILKGLHDISEEKEVCFVAPTRPILWWIKEKVEKTAIDLGLRGFLHKITYISLSNVEQELRGRSYDTIVHYDHTCNEHL
jgi:hypothetical protein